MLPLLATSKQSDKSNRKEFQHQSVPYRKVDAIQWKIASIPTISNQGRFYFHTIYLKGQGFKEKSIYIYKYIILNIYYIFDDYASDLQGLKDSRSVRSVFGEILIWRNGWLVLETTFFSLSILYQELVCMLGIVIHSMYIIGVLVLIGVGGHYLFIYFRNSFFSINSDSASIIL